MRIRMLGHHVPVSMAALSAIEAMVFFCAVYGALWPRALLFSAIMMACFLAFGLYSLRQQARLAGIALRVTIALLAGFVITATLFYLVPALWMGPGVVALAAIGGLCGVTVLRLIFSHVVDENVFKRHVLVNGAGESAMATAGLRRRADRRGFVVAGFVPAHPTERAVAFDRIHVHGLTGCVPEVGARRSSAIADQVNRPHVATAVPREELGATDRFRAVEVDGSAREAPGICEKPQLGIVEPVPDAAINRKRVDEMMPQSSLITP